MNQPIPSLINRSYVIIYTCRFKTDCYKSGFNTYRKLLYGLKATQGGWYICFYYFISNRPKCVSRHCGDDVVAAAAAVQPDDAVCSNHCLVDNIFEIDTLTKAIEDA